jgi:hypothetical protein
MVGQLASSDADDMDRGVAACMHEEWRTAGAWRRRGRAVEAFRF